jgi:hypothetical protein
MLEKQCDVLDIVLNRFRTDIPKAAKIGHF